MMVPRPNLLTRQKLKLLVLLSVAVVTATFLAGSLTQLELLPGEEFPLGAILQALRGEGRPVFPLIPVPINIMRLLIACVWLLFIVSIIIFIISPEARKGMLKRIMRFILLFLLVYGLMYIMQDLVLQPEPQTQEPGALGELAEEPLEPLPTPPDFVVNPPGWFVTGVTIFLMVLLLGIGWFIWRYFNRWGHEPATLERLAHEAQEALKGLQAGADLRDVIMRCYFEMSQILNNERGLRRQEAMTPREFEAYLAQSGLRSEHIQRLTRLFESVRYGNKSPGQQEEQEAITCLTVISQTYGRS
jgi:hypothetical protein